MNEAWAPGAFTYETLLPNDMLILTISLAYSVIALLNSSLASFTLASAISFSVSRLVPDSLHLHSCSFSNQWEWWESIKAMSDEIGEVNFLVKNQKVKSVVQFYAYFSMMLYIVELMFMCSERLIVEA